MTLSWMFSFTGVLRTRTMIFHTDLIPLVDPIWDVLLHWDVDKQGLCYLAPSLYCLMILSWVFTFSIRMLMTQFTITVHFLQAA